MTAIKTIRNYTNRNFIIVTEYIFNYICVFKTKDILKRSIGFKVLFNPNFQIILLIDLAADVLLLLVDYKILMSLSNEKFIRQACCALTKI